MKQIEQLARKLQELDPEEQLQVIEELRSMNLHTLEEDMNAIIQENLPALMELAK